MSDDFRGAATSTTTKVTTTAAAATAATTQARREGGGGKVLLGPVTFGGPPLLKNTEKGVPDGFFRTSSMHKIRRGGPHCGSIRCSPRPIVGLKPPHICLDLAAYGMRLCRCDSSFPGPAVALDGPATITTTTWLSY